LERILNDDERIRRAEEVYFRRNNKVPAKHLVNKGKSKNSLWFNLLIMFNLAVIVFAVQNKDYIFTSEFLEKVNTYNVTIGIKIKEFLKDEETGDNEINSVEDNEEMLEQTDANTNTQQVEEPLQQESSSISEMEMDINNLKSSYSFAKPLSYYSVSSLFGSRESEYQNVTGYHTGVDLASEMGNTINASMEGIVELVSKEGDYGKHLKIRCNNVTTLYAHCSNIFVKEGQIVAQGQPIAAVGSTGNSTGPHLHFEIRVDDRFVNPSKVIDL